MSGIELLYHSFRLNNLLYRQVHGKSISTMYDFGLLTAVYVHRAVHRLLSHGNVFSRSLVTLHYAVVHRTLCLPNQVNSANHAHYLLTNVEFWTVLPEEEG